MASCRIPESRGDTTRGGGEAAKPATRLWVGGSGAVVAAQRACWVGDAEEPPLVQGSRWQQQQERSRAWVCLVAERGLRVLGKKKSPQICPRGGRLVPG